MNPQNNTEPFKSRTLKGARIQGTTHKLDRRGWASANPHLQAEAASAQLGHRDGQVLGFGIRLKGLGVSGLGKL